MPFDVDRLLRLWTDPLPEDDGAAAAAFRELYSDALSPMNRPGSTGGRNTSLLHRQ
jgi:hypothetical protein